MYSKARKLHIIEEVLKIDSDDALTALEEFIVKSSKGENIKTDSGFRNFSGIWSNDEAEEIKSIIAESCENVHPDDWK